MTPYATIWIKIAVVSVKKSLSKTLVSNRQGFWQNVGHQARGCKSFQKRFESISFLLRLSVADYPYGEPELPLCVWKPRTKKWRVRLRLSSFPSLSKKWPWNFSFRSFAVFLILCITWSLRLFHLEKCICLYQELFEVKKVSSLKASLNCVKRSIVVCVGYNTALKPKLTALLYVLLIFISIKYIIIIIFTIIIIIIISKFCGRLAIPKMKLLQIQKSRSLKKKTHL